MKKIRKLLIAALIVCLVFLMPMTASAKSKKAKAALKAYKTILSQSRINVVPYRTNFKEDGYYLNFCWAKDVSFCTGYFNNDKIPELFLKGSDGRGHCDCAAIFTYKDGSVVRLAYKDNDGTPFSSIKSFCRKRKVFRCNVHGIPHMMRCYKGRIKVLAIKWEEDLDFSGRTGRKNIRKYTKGRRLTRIKWHINTNANRYRYL